jgi:magnesium chelatase family protein
MSFYYVVATLQTMIAKVLSAALQGASARVIEVEADLKQGLPGIQVIGMGDKAVSEARERPYLRANTPSDLHPPLSVKMALSSMSQLQSHY